MACYKSVSTAALLVALTAPASFADVTGAQVWSDWKTYLETFGYETTGTETQSGDTLTIRDIDMTITVPQEDTTAAFSMETLSFTDNADGTVSVGLPAQMPLSFNVDPDTGEAAEVTLLLEQTAQTLTVSGDPGDYTYDYSAGAMTITMDGVVSEGVAIPPDVIGFVLGMTDINSTTRTSVGEGRSYESTFSAADMTYEMAFEVEGPEASAGRATGALRGISVSGTGKAPDLADGTLISEMVAAGFESVSSMTFQSGNSDIRIDPADEPGFAATTQSGGGTFDVRIGAQGLRYDLVQNDIEITAQLPDFPFPVSFAIAENAFTLGMPVTVSSDPQDFAFGFKLGDFTMSDVLWNLFDPGVQLPRDPATLELDLSGTARMLSDIFDPAAMASNAAPGEINTLDIRALVIDMIGARLSGTGGFTFDNSDRVTFNGVPRPEGALDLRLEGANALLDRLVGMGLLPQEQAMGARMMMGLFGVPQGDDTLTSKIEVNAQGHVLANGQRLQ